MNKSNSKANMPVKTKSTSQAWVWAITSQLAIIALAFIFQVSGKHIVLPLPWNWLVLSAFILICVILAMQLTRAPLIQWLAGAQFAVTSIAVVAVIGAIGTFIVQDPSKMDMLTRIGLRSLFTKPPFAAAILLILMNLSMATGRRLVSPRAGQVGFMLNHVGLILVILGMFAGTAQFQRIILRVPEGETVSQGMDEQGKIFNIGGDVTLNKFEIEKYPPKLGAVEFLDNDQQVVHADQQWVKKNHDFTAFNMKIHVVQYYPLAFPNEEGGWSKVDSHGLPAALIRFTPPGGETHEEWVVAGIDSLGISPTTASIDDTHLIFLQEQEAKSFRSHLTIKATKNNQAHYLLEVNKPVPINSWMLYQNSYEISMGGRTSIIEAVRDPALPVVYCGFLAMILGAFIALWISYKGPKDSTMTTNITAEKS